MSAFWRRIAVSLWTKLWSGVGVLLRRLAKRSALSELAEAGVERAFRVPGWVSRRMGPTCAAGLADGLSGCDWLVNAGAGAVCFFASQSFPSRQKKAAAAKNITLSRNHVKGRQRI